MQSQGSREKRSAEELGDPGGRSFIAFTVQIWRRRGLFWQNGDPISAPFARRRRNRTQVQTLGCPEKCHPRRRRRNQHLPNGIPERGPQGKTEEEAWDWRTGCLILEVPRKNGGGDPGQAPGKSASGDRNLRLELKNR